MCINLISDKNRNAIIPNFQLLLGSWVRIFATLVIIIIFSPSAHADLWGTHLHTDLVNGSNMDLTAIASDGDKLRIIDAGGIYSTNSSGRTIRQVAALKYLLDINWYGGLWVAVGGGVIYTSEDGDHWIKRSAAVPSEISKIAGGADGWIACISDFGSYLYSSDGISWTTRNTGINFHPGTIAWANGYWISTGVLGIARSSDGLNWTIVSDQFTKSIIWTGSVWQAVTALGTILSSSDGIVWTQDSGSVGYGNTFASSGSQSIVVGTFGNIYASDGSGSWAKIDSPTNKDIFAVKWSGSCFVAVGQSGLILSSKDGLAWDLLRSIPSEMFSGVCEGPNELLAVTFRGEVFGSKDGLSWHAISRINDFRVEEIIWTGNEYLAAGNRAIHSSQDGKTWTSHDAPENSSVLALTSDSERTVAVGRDGLILLKDNIHQWTLIPSPTTSNLIDVEKGGEIYLAITNDGSTLRSSDGITWQTMTSTDSLNSLVWTGSRFIGVSSEGSVLETLDGSSWTEIQAFPGTSLESVTASEEKIVAVGYEMIYCRTPSGTWTKTPVGANLAKVVSYKHGFIAAGIGLMSSTDGRSWTSRLPIDTGKGATAWGSGRFVKAGGRGGVITSDKGDVWTWRPDEVGHPLVDILYHSGKFIAVGGGGSVISSDDGINWTPMFVPGNPHLVRVEAFLDGYLARDVSGAIAKYEPSTGWSTATPIIPDESASVISLATSSTTAVCVSYDGQVFSSTDGLNWTSRNRGKRGVIWDGSKFIAYGFSGTSTSSDGVTWEEQPLTTYPLGIWVGYVDGTYVIEKNGMASLVGSPETSWEEIPTSWYPTNSLAYDGSRIILGDMIFTPDLSKSFSEWAHKYGITDGSVGLNEDIDGDGIPNGIAFLMGHRIPTATTTKNSLPINISGPYLGNAKASLTSQWPAPEDIVESIWFSNDLSEWKRVSMRTSQGWMSVSPDAQVSISGQEGIQEVHISVSESTSSTSGFFRRSAEYVLPKEQ